eukprot:TRINITY_DN681_c0_g1_i2.p1 TRINITY_DN681_c0_g1~~TRINITY_DN681_c0_g1_i2.p1  ORF type:complete len:189 (+),score=46.06 TRINITY_DN681_c0_g1_i2:1485-2051(+)
MEPYDPDTEQPPKPRLTLAHILPDIKSYGLLRNICVRVSGAYLDEKISCSFAIVTSGDSNALNVKILEDESLVPGQDDPFDYVHLFNKNLSISPAMLHPMLGKIYGPVRILYGVHAGKEGELISFSADSGIGKSSSSTSSSSSSSNPESQDVLVSFRDETKLTRIERDCVVQIIEQAKSSSSSSDSDD